MFQRRPHDRRQRKAKTSFPVTDSHGEIVQHERRSLADRRLAGLQTEWDEMIHEARQPADAGSPRMRQTGK